MNSRSYKTALRVFLVVGFLISLFAVTPAMHIHAAGRCYVDDSAVFGANTGLSWANAYTSLQSAIASSCTEIWVAAGMYKPHASDRNVSFNLESGTAIYGGFEGTETQRTQRNYTFNVTILSGDLNGNDIGFTNNGENSYHIVYASSVNNTAILDGFTVQGGNANTSASAAGSGGGMLNDTNSNPTLYNITFNANYAINHGGGMYNEHNSNPTLINVTFSANFAQYGGGISNYDYSSPILTNVTFRGNSAYYGGGMNNSDDTSNPSLTDVTFHINSATYGGGMYNYNSSPTFTSVTFNDNSANYGGGMYNYYSGPTLTSVTFYDNSAEHGGGLYNLYSSPILTNVSFNTNSAVLLGGGMFNYASNATLTSVTFSNNSAARGGGMYSASNGESTLSNVTFISNSADHGGGMYNYIDSPTLTNVTFNGNSVNGIGAKGGGMHNDNSSPSLTSVTFNGNTAYGGGGMYNTNSSPSLNNVTFSFNSANYGGGMYTLDSSPSITNVTFSGNTVTNSGGGMYNISSSSTLTNVTFSGNTAYSGGGMYTSNSPTLINVIIANSTAGGDCMLDVGASISTSSKNNLIESTGSNACGLTNGSNGNIIGSDPKLGSLTGSPAYFPLNAGSPAIDTGVNTGCPAADQRGMKRPQGVKCDIGAFESIATTTFKSSGPNDGWILESTEASGTGGSMNNAATTFNLGDNATDKQYRSILYFNTASLPDNAVITKVVLKLKQNGIVGGGNPIADFQGIFVDLKKGLFGAATLQLTDFNAAANKTLGPVSPPLVSGWYSIALTNGKAQINKVGATQVRLGFKLDDNNNNIANFLKLYSGNAAIASRPQLIITYYTP